MVGEMPHLILMTGPSGAGKSTTAATWAQFHAAPTALVSVDDVRHFVKAGYVSPKDAYTEEAHRQFDLAREHCAFLAGRYVDAGFNCVVDDLILPDYPGSRGAMHHYSWVAALGSRPHVVVVLLPSLDVTLQRNATREDREPINEEMTRVIHELMMPWKEIPAASVIDNSSLSPAETARAVDAMMELRSVRPTPRANLSK
jgi:predicted kinase